MTETLDRMFLASKGIPLKIVEMRILTTKWVGKAWEKATSNPEFMRSTFERTGLSLPISDTTLPTTTQRTLIDGSLDAERIKFYGNDEPVEAEPLSDSSESSGDLFSSES